MTRLELALAAAEQRTPETFALLEQWVRQNSFTGVPENVNAMGEHLKRAFALPGLELEVQPGSGFGDHLVWRTAQWSAAQDRRLLLVGHHDTVFPPGSFDGLERDGDKWRGPGVLDMKGGIATVWCALRALADAGALEALALAFVSVADEEVGSPDSRPFTRHWAVGARGALVFEAGRIGDLIITQRKGTGALKVFTTGRAAHAGASHRDGLSAIRPLARFVDAAEALTDYERGVTVNVGTIRGGTSKNTVPEHAELELDLRVAHAEDGPRIVRELGELAARLEAETGVGFRLEGGLRRPPLERSPGSVALRERYAAHARAEGLGGDESPLLGGGSDANDVAAVGVPVIDGLGPRGRFFHTRDEYIEAATLPRRAAALVRFLCDWAG